MSIHCFESSDQRTNLEGKTVDQDGGSYRTSRRDTAKAGKLTLHSYLGHLSAVEKEQFGNKRQVLGTCDPYTSPAALFQSYSCRDKGFQMYGLSYVFSIWMGK